MSSEGLPRFRWRHRQVGPSELKRFAVEEIARRYPGRPLAAGYQQVKGRGIGERLDKALGGHCSSYHVIVIDYQPCVFGPLTKVLGKHLGKSFRFRVRS